MSQTRTIWCLVAAIGVLVGASVPTVAWALETPSIQVIDKSDQRPAEFEAVGLPSSLLKKLASLEPTDPEFSKVFTITVASDPVDSSIPPVSGKYRVDGSRLVFVPRYPPQAGLTYRAVLHADAADNAGNRIERDILIPKPVENPNRPATHVQRVYPSDDVLPENHLRFYIHFTRPMSRAAAYSNLELLDEKDQPLKGSFLELGEELWDVAGQRFTLLLDPGRIKRGLKPREEEGPILEAGKQYTLVVKRGWRDARGELLKADFRKVFKAGAAVEKPLDVAGWKVTAPVGGTRGSVSVKLPGPLDNALLGRALTVTDAAGKQVPGRIIVCNAERQWTFTSDTRWQQGRYELVVDTVLEDSAGNRIGQAFDVDQVETVTRQVVPEFVRIPFDVKPRDSDATKP